MPTNGTLYVFLHGLTVGHERKRKLELALPQVKGHVYRAGSWLMETDIKPGSTLPLKGVNPGNASLGAAQHVIQLKGCSLTSKGRTATLRFPLPRDILELLLIEETITLQNKKLGARFAVGGPPAKVATILVLVYDYKDENEVILENHYWEPCSIGGAISLHVISTSIGQEGKDHVADTNKALKKLITNFPGLKFGKPPIHRAPNWNETMSPLYGDLAGHNLGALGENIVTTPGPSFAFAQTELEGIPTRTVRIGRLGRMKQQGRPVGSLWHEPDPLFDTPCDCGHIHLGG